MPVYEYYCEECDHEFEKEMKISLKPRKCACPKCKKKCERIFGYTTVIYKGSGFYTTDKK